MPDLRISGFAGRDRQFRVQGLRPGVLDVHLGGIAGLFPEVTPVLTETFLEFLGYCFDLLERVGCADIALFADLLEAAIIELHLSRPFLFKGDGVESLHDDHCFLDRGPCQARE